jgi:tetratricopeptide (TPR) repeat protein
MLDNFGDSVGFPDAEPGASSVDRGRLAGVFLRLYARRFTGLAYVSSQSRTMTFAFRDGIPVMIDSSAPESSLADDLVERGILTRDEYADLIARVTEDLVENEDVAICEHAVSLGYLSEEQIRRELAERVRSKLIQSLALVDCEIELDDASDALIGVAEYPQNLGAAVYMGVRTFYEEDVLRGYLPDLKRSYMRLLKAPAEIARFFELDDDEVALLNAIDSQERAIEWFERSELETSHAVQLIGLLLIGGMCEFSSSAFVPPEAERSGVRTAAARPDSGRLRGGTPAALQRPGSRAGIPAVREEVYEPRAGSRAGMPAVTSRPASAAPSDPRMEPNTSPATSRSEGSGAHNSPRRNEGSGAHSSPRREGSGAHSSPRPTDGSGAWNAPRRPIIESNDRTEGSGAFNPPRRNEGPGDQAAYRRAPAADPSISRPRSASSPHNSASQPRAANDPASRPLTGALPTSADASDPTTDAAAEALAEARARARDRRGAPHAKPSSSANQAVRNPAGAQPAAAALRNLGAPNATAGSPAAAPVQTSPEYQKAHLKELMNRKQHGGAGEGGPVQVSAPRRDPARELRSAQEALRDGQYARAEEILRVLVEQSPADDTIRTYYLWAQLRASQPLDASQLAKLKDLAKRLIPEAAHASFACYVLAHLYLADKKDDQAEKYFRKAHALDKTNTDAERHIVILERRKQHASEADAGGQRKFLGITLGKKTNE